MPSFSNTTPDKTSVPLTQGKHIQIIQYRSTLSNICQTSSFSGELVYLIFIFIGSSSSTPSFVTVTSYTDNTGTQPHHSASANTTNEMGRNLAYHPQTGEWLENPPLTTNEINQSARRPLIQASTMAWVDACAKGLIPAHQASDNQLVYDPQTSERSDFPQTDGEHNKPTSPTHIQPNNTIGIDSGSNFHNQASNNQSVSESPYQNNAVLVNRLAAESLANQGYEVVTVEDFFRLAHAQDSNIPPAPNGGQHVGNTQPQQFEVLSAEDFIRFCEERDKIQHAHPVFIQGGNKGKRAIEELYEENNGTFYTPDADMAHSSKKRKMSLNWHANNTPQVRPPNSQTLIRKYSDYPIKTAGYPAQPVSCYKQRKPEQYHIFRPCRSPTPPTSTEAKHRGKGIRPQITWLFRWQPPRSDGWLARPVIQASEKRKDHSIHGGTRNPV